MALALIIQANGWVVALAAVCFTGATVLLWHRTGTIKTAVATVEIASNSAAQNAATSAAKAEDIAQAVGNPNGSGPIASMVERVEARLDSVSDAQNGVALRIADFERLAYRRHEENKVAIAAMGARVSDLATRLDSLGVPGVDQ